MKSDRPYSGTKNRHVIISIFLTLLITIFISCEKKANDPLPQDILKAAGIDLVVPANLSDSVVVDPVLSVTFNNTIDPKSASADITLKKGSVTVPGAISFTGTTAIFTASTDLAPESEYVATVKTKAKSGEDDQYSWTFKTGKHHSYNSLSVVSVQPVSNATGVSVSSPVTINFNKDIISTMMRSVAVILKNGDNPVTGTLTFSGRTATFQPSAELLPNTVYTGRVIIGSADHMYDNESANYFSWKFTTSAGAADVTAPTILSVLPANNATSVAAGTKATVNFSEAMNPSTITAATFSLKQGSTVIAGTVTYIGTTATFTPSTALAANTTYSAAISTGAKDLAGNAIASSYTWSFTTTALADVTPPAVLSVVPLNTATGVSATAKATATFSEAMNPSTITTATFSLKQGSAVIAGTVTYTGTTATFTPSVALVANTTYSAAISTGAKDLAGNALASAYTWSFTTAAAADVTPPTVLSVTPLMNATSVAVSTRPTVTFSEAMNASTISASTFTLKQGTVNIAGTVSYSGSTATFTPSSALSASTVYTATITTGAKDAAGNALAANYVWSFTTAVPADVTPPSVTSVTPANNATSVAVTGSATAVFSETMNASTINTGSFTMKQGSLTIAGTVSYSGTTATFKPSSSLAAGTVYTCSITTAAKDVAGNAIASTYTWSFTTAPAAPAGKSFSADVVPILAICNTCHTHPWTTSSNASTFYTNLVSGGYVNPASPTTSKIYTKLSGGHPGSTVTTAQVNTILTWMTEGSKNN